MKNLKRNSWIKIWVIFSIFSFVTFLNNTNAFAQAAAGRESAEGAAPALDLGDLGGDEALLDGENLPGDESSAEELLRTQADPSGSDETIPVVEEEATFVLASPEEQEALKTEVADLLLQVDPQTASIIQGELSTAISAGTIVLGEATGADAATDAQAILPDQAVATVAQQLSKSADAQKTVLNNLNQLKQTLTAPATLGTGTGSTAPSQEALKSIGAMELAIKSGNQKAIQEAMKTAAETFRAFGPEMGMAFGGPRGDFGPGGAGPMGGFEGPGPMGPVGFEGGGGFFDRAFSGALPPEMMRTFSEGPGGAFDHGRMAEIAGEFMTKVGTDVMGRMAMERGMAPQDVFIEMNSRGFTPDMLAKSAEAFANEFKNNPDAFRGPMGGGPMEGGGFRGGPGGDVFSPTQPPGGWTTETSALQAQYQGVDLFGPQGPGAQGGWSPEAFARGPEMFGRAGSTPFEVGGNYRGFDPAGASQEFQDNFKVLEVAGLSSREFFAAPRELEFFRQDFLDARLALPSSIIAPVITPSGGGQVSNTPTQEQINAYHTVWHNYKTLGQSGAQAGQSTAIEAKAQYGEALGAAIAQAVGALVQNAEHIATTPGHAAPAPAPAPAPAQTIRAGDAALRSLVVNVNHLSSNNGGLHRITYANVPANYQAMLSGGSIPNVSNYTVNPNGSISINWGGQLKDAINQDVVAANVVHVNEPAPARQTPTDAERTAAEQKFHYENYRSNSGQTAAQAFVTWVGQQNYPSQAVRDAIRNDTQAQNQNGQPHTSSAEDLAAKRAAIQQLRDDIAASRVADCHSLQLHNDAEVAAEHATLSNVHCD